MDITTQEWAQIITDHTADYAAYYGPKKANIAKKLYAVGYATMEDQHGRNSCPERPVWVSLHQDEDEARAAADRLLHSWQDAGWVTRVVIRQDQQRIASIERPLVRCGDYRAPSSSELHKRMGI